MKKSKKNSKTRTVRPVPKSCCGLWDKKIDSTTGIAILVVCLFAAVLSIQYITDLAGILIRSQVFYY